MPSQTPKRGRSSPRANSAITLEEIADAFATSDRYGPLLNLSQAAELAELAPSTLKRKVSEGHFHGCVSRGKPLRFWRDRFVLNLMSKK